MGRQPLSQMLRTLRRMSNQAEEDYQDYRTAHREKENAQTEYETAKKSIEKLRNYLTTIEAPNSLKLN